MATLLANDVISGREGKVITKINNIIKEHAEIRTIEATVEKTKADIRVMGSRAVKHKATGWNGMGNVTFYYVTSDWAKMMLEYCKTGIDVYFDMTVINEDAGSSAKRQEILLKRCNMDSAVITRLDTETDFLDTSFDFTFEDWDIIREFNVI